MLTLIQLLLTSLPWLGLSNAREPVVAPTDRAAGVSSTRDCNGNGVDDSVDIAIGTSGDLDQNGIPDECQGIVRSAGMTCSSAGRAGLWLPRPLLGAAAQSPPRSGHLPVPWSGGRDLAQAWRPLELVSRAP